MHAVGHSVGLEGLEHGVLDGLGCGDVFKHQRVRTVLQALKVLFHLVDAPSGDPQTFPYGVPALYHAIQHADARFLSFHKPIDPAPRAGISGVRLVEFGHGLGIQRLGLQSKVMFETSRTKRCEVRRHVAMGQRPRLPA